MKKQSAIFSILQSIGRSFMLPIALLPIAGLLLGIGASFTNQTTVASYNLGWLLGTGTFLNYILEVMSSVGNVIFGNLPIIFAVGVALGMAKSEKAAAALSGLIAFLSMHTVISSMLKLSGQLNAEIIGTNITNTCGIVTLNMGVFGGILVGLLVGWLHNKFYKIKFPDYLSFFSGIRFVPIISAIFHIFIGFIMFYLWPIIQNLMFSSSGIVGKSGPIGILVYGIIKRSLIPFGLHHVFYMPFWQTALGGTEIIDGVSISGAQNIFFAQLASGNTKFFSIEATKFFSGEFLFMIFGLPGAALAMYTTSKPHKKPIIGGLLFSAALTSILTGITEPIEFTFLFVAPLLYGAHCVLAGISHMATYMCKISVGLTFSGGLIDYLLFGIFQGNTKTNWIYIFPLGICCFGIYYFLFKFLIIKFNFLTPGREADDLKSKLFTKEDYKNVNWDQNIAAIIVNCLGGAGNIETIDSCATRLRVEVKDTTKVSESELRKNGAAGIITKGKGIQVIFGPKVTTIKSEIDEYLEKMKEDKQIENVFFDVQKLGCYHNNIKVLDSVSFKIKKGEFVIIFGNNGSGKSTLAKHLNALILPDEGDVFVDGMNTKLEEFCFKIRQKVSFTFQNPDNQIVADRIEHDVAFGPENLGLSTEEIRYNVNKALKLVGLYEQKDSYIKTLSGGNKQKLVIAGAIAMGAECLVLDEPTSMLDETSKREILNKILVLNQEKNITIILLTHNLDEFNFAKRILILENGKLISDVSNMNSTDSNFFHKNMNMKCELKSENMLDSSKKNEILRFDNVSYKYENTQKLIFDNINIKFHENEVVGIMGRTGSGKTTLINLIKNFFCPTKGKILFRNKLMTQEFRFKTGIVFQYPENQLFEETVLKDVMFGPKNMGHPVEYALKIAKKSLEFMNFDESKFELSPFSLSGGEMRKVAIAGIIAMDPEILILDEPTAGLDYFARRDFLCSLANLHKKNHNTIIIISHCYEDLYFICNRILLIENSKIKKYKFN